MQNNRRQFYIFDLELAARKAGASIPTINDVVPILERMKNTTRIYSLYDDTAKMLIGDMAVDNVQQFITLLVRLSDTKTPNSVYSDPIAGQFNEHVKVGNIGSDFGCHVLISTAPERNQPNIYTCAIERIPGLPFDLVRRFLSKLLKFEYTDDATSFSYLHPAGGLDANNQPRRDRCCPHVLLRGRPSETLINDINTGRISSVSLIKSELVAPIAGAPFLTKSKSELKLNIDHNNLPANLWAALRQALQLNAQSYSAAQVKYKVPNSSRTVTVEIDSATGAPLTEMYVMSFELTQIFPFLAQSAMIIVAHLHSVAVPQFLLHRTI